MLPLICTVTEVIIIAFHVSGPGADPPDQGWYFHNGYPTKPSCPRRAKKIFARSTGCPSSHCSSACESYWPRSFLFVNICTKSRCPTHGHACLCARQGVGNGLDAEQRRGKLCVWGNSPHLQHTNTNQCSPSHDSPRRWLQELEQPPRRGTRGHFIIHVAFFLLAC